MSSFDMPRINSETDSAHRITPQEITGVVRNAFEGPGRDVKLELGMLIDALSRFWPNWRELTRMYPALITAMLMVILTACGPAAPAEVQTGSVPTAVVIAAPEEASPEPTVSVKVIVEPTEVTGDVLSAAPTAEPTPSPEPSPTPVEITAFSVEQADAEAAQRIYDQFINHPGEVQIDPTTDQNFELRVWKDLTSGATIVLNQSILTGIMDSLPDNSSDQEKLDAVRNWLATSELATAARLLSTYNPNRKDTFAAARKGSVIALMTNPADEGTPESVQTSVGTVMINSSIDDPPLQMPKIWSIPPAIRVLPDGTFDQKPTSLGAPEGKVYGNYHTFLELFTKYANDNGIDPYRFRWTVDDANNTIAIVDDDYVRYRYDQTAGKWQEVFFEWRNQQAPTDWWQLDNSPENLAIKQQALEEFMTHVTIEGFSPEEEGWITEGIRLLAFVEPRTMDPAIGDSVYPNWLLEALADENTPPILKQLFENPLLALRGVRVIKNNPGAGVWSELNGSVVIDKAYFDNWLSYQSQSDQFYQAAYAGALLKEGGSTLWWYWGNITEAEAVSNSKMDLLTVYFMIVGYNLNLTEGTGLESVAKKDLGLIAKSFKKMMEELSNQRGWTSQLPTVY